VIRTVIDGTQGLTWVDVVEPTSAELTEIAHLYGLHPTSVRDCLDPEHLPKFERFPDRFFIIIRVFDVASTADCATVNEMTRKVAIFSGPGFVVTIHRKPLPFLTGLQQQWRVSEGGEGNAEPLTHRLILDIIDRGLATFEPPLEKIEEGLDEIEEALFQNRHDSEDLLDLYVLRRRTTLTKRMLWRSLEVLKLFSPPADASTPHYQDVRESAEAMHFYSDELLESANNLTNLQLSLSSQKTNQVMRILTLFSAFFLPLTFLVGVYGMNFEYMPELTLRWGYPAVWVVMVIITLVIYSWFRRRGWLKL
jgi:magnesium transporter